MINEEELKRMIPGKRKIVSFSLQEDNLKSLKTFCIARGISASGVIDVFIDTFLDNFKKAFDKTQKKVILAELDKRIERDGVEATFKRDDKIFREEVGKSTGLTGKELDEQVKKEIKILEATKKEYLKKEEGKKKNG